MANYKILVTEDDTVLRDLYLRKFDRAVYDIETAENGEEAVQKITQGNYDLILLDINMPTLDGWGAMEKLAATQKQYPIIVLTNYDDQANRERGKKFGVLNYYVKKEMSVKGLLEMVDNAVKNKVKA